MDSFYAKNLHYTNIAPVLVLVGVGSDVVREVAVRGVWRSSFATRHSGRFGKILSENYAFETWSMEE